MGGLVRGLGAHLRHEENLVAPLHNALVPHLAGILVLEDPAVQNLPRDVVPRVGVGLVALRQPDEAQQSRPDLADDLAVHAHARFQDALDDRSHAGVSMGGRAGDQPRPSSDEGAPSPSDLQKRPRHPETLSTSSGSDPESSAFASSPFCF